MEKTSSASEKRRRFAVEKCTLRTAEAGDLRRSGGVAERLSLSGGGEVKARLAEAAGRAVEGDHRRVVDEPIDEGGGDLVGEQEVVARSCSGKGWPSTVLKRDAARPSASPIRDQ